MPNRQPDHLASGGTSHAKPVVIRVAGVSTASLVIDSLLMSGLLAALFLPVAYTASRIPGPADHMVRGLLLLSWTIIVAAPAVMKLLPLLGGRFDEGIIEISADRVIAVAIGPRRRVRQECRIADVRAMEFSGASTAIVVWVNRQPKALLQGLDRRSLRLAASQLRAMTRWPTPAEVRRAARAARAADGRHHNADFRQEAVALSEATIASRGAAERLDWTSAGVSLCIPAPHDPTTLRRVLAVLTILLAVVAFGGLLAGFSVIPILARRGFLPSRSVGGLPAYLWISGAAVLIGWAAMLTMVRARNFVVLRWLRTRGATRPFAPSGSPTAMVSIEDPATASRLKLIDDDVAALYADPARKLILLEGCSHRYVIRAQDVVKYYPKVFITVPAVMIAFRVGGSDHVLELKLAQVVVTARRDGSGCPWSPLPETLQLTFGFPMSAGPSMPPRAAQFLFDSFLK